MKVPVSFVGTSKSVGGARACPKGDVQNCMGHSRVPTPRREGRKEPTARHDSEKMAKIPLFSRKVYIDRINVQTIPCPEATFPTNMSGTQYVTVNRELF